MLAEELPPDAATSQVEYDVERHVLSLTVKLSDGTEGNIYRRSDRRNYAGIFTYDCRLCGVANLPGERCLQTHIGGRKHQAKLAQPLIDAALFRMPLQRNKPQISMKIAPGEPVPPGFENEVKVVAALQSTLDACKNQSLVGVEYIVELTNGMGNEPSYHCVMCDKRGDPRTIMFHMTSHTHRLKFLEKHFPTVVKEIHPYRFIKDVEIRSRIMQTICEAIEETHGRLSPSVYDYQTYEKTKMRVLQLINCDKHLDEKMGSSFVHVIDHKAIQCAIDGDLSALGMTRQSTAMRNDANAASAVSTAAAAALDILDMVKSNPKSGAADEASPSAKRARRESLDSISSFSDSSVKSMESVRSGRKAKGAGTQVIGTIDLRSRSRSLSPLSKKAAEVDKQIMPTPKQLAMQSSEIAKDGYAWEKYRCLLKMAMPELEKKLQDHEKNPEKHPLYPEEWKKFWNRRYKELTAEKKDPSKHDFKPEWVEFWMGRLKEMHADEVEAKKLELRKRLNLPENGAERNVKQQYALKINLKTTSLPAVAAPTSTSRSSAGASSSGRRSSPDRRSTRRRSRSRSPASRRPERRRSRSPRRRRSRSRSPARRSSRSPTRRSTRSPTRRSSRSPHRRRATRSPTGGGRPSVKRTALLSRPVATMSDGRALSPLSDVECIGDAPLIRGVPAKDQYPPSYYGTKVIAMDEWGRPVYYTPPALLEQAYAAPPYFREATSAPMHVLKKQRPAPSTTSAASASKPSHGDGGKTALDDEPVTVVSVLRLLTALEELLGSLGPKVIDLLAKALSLEKVKPNSADDMLVNEDTCVLFETIKEKLKGQLIADVVQSHKVAAVKRAVKNVAIIIHLVNEKTKKEQKEKAAAAAAQPAVVVVAPPVVALPPVVVQTPTVVAAPVAVEDRAAIAASIARALAAQGKTDMSPDQLAELINVYQAIQKAKQGNANVTAATYYQTSVDAAGVTPAAVPVTQHAPPSAAAAVAAAAAASAAAADEDAANALKSLTDGDLQTLLQNFQTLSRDEQRHLIAHLQKLEKTQPKRVETLRKFVNVDVIASAHDDNDDDQQVDPPEKIMYPSKAVLQKTAADRAAAAAAAAAASTRPKVANFIDDHSDEDIDNQQQQLQRSHGSGNGTGSNGDRRHAGPAHRPNAAPVVPLVESDDDDDYSYDDVFKAASQKVQEKQLADQRREEEARQRKLEEDFANAGRTGDNSGGGGAGSTLTLADTQNMIANLMGSLQKNVQNKGLRAQTQQQQQQQQHQQQHQHHGAMPAKDPTPIVILDELDIEPRVPPSAATNRPAPPPPSHPPTSAGSVPYYQQQQQQHGGFYQHGSTAAASASASLRQVAYPVQPPPPPPEQPPPPPPQPPQQQQHQPQPPPVQYPYAHAAAAVQYPGYGQSAAVAQQPAPPAQQPQQQQQQQQQQHYGQNAAYAAYLQQQQSAQQTHMQYQQQQQQYQQHYQQWQQQQAVVPPKQPQPNVQQQLAATTATAQAQAQYGYQNRMPGRVGPVQGTQQQQQQQQQQQMHRGVVMNNYRMNNNSGYGGNNQQQGFF